MKNELVPDTVDAVNGHDHLPVSAVLGLKVVEIKLTLGWSVATAIE